MHDGMRRAKREILVNGRLMKRVGVFFDWRRGKASSKVSSMKWICLMALFLVSCGSDPVSQPFLAKPIPKKKVELPQSKVTPADSGVSQKVFAGKVTFQDLTDKELAAFRVIPESGKTLITPKNATYKQVDGLWWQGAKPDTWFKIPGSSEAWIGKAPERFDGVAREGELEIFYRSNALVKIAGFVKRSVSHPSWVRNEGVTSSPVSSPWGEG